MHLHLISNPFGQIPQLIAKTAQLFDKTATMKKPRLPAGFYIEFLISF